MNGSALVMVNEFQSANSKPDRNEKNPILLVSIAGKMPNRAVLSGTIAERNGFEVGKKYMISYTEGETNQYGRQFSFTNEGEVTSVADTLLLKKEYGAPQIINVDIQETPEPTVVQSSVPQREPVVAQTTEPVVAVQHEAVTA